MPPIDKTAQLLGLFQQSYADGTRNANSLIQQSRNLEQQNKELEIQKQAEKFRQDLAGKKEGRAADKANYEKATRLSPEQAAEANRLELNSLRSGVELKGKQVAGYDETSALNNRLLQSQVGLGEKKTAGYDVQAAADLEARKTQTDLLRNQIATLRENRQANRAAMTNQGAAAQRLAALASKGPQDAANKGRVTGAVTPGDFRRSPGNASAAVSDYVRLREKAGLSLSAAETKEVRTAAKNMAVNASAMNRMGRKFEAIKRVTGLDDMGQALKTLAGNPDMVKTVWPAAAKNARTLQSLNAELKVMAIAALKAEPNNKKTQDEINNRFQVREGSSDEEVAAVLADLMGEFEKNDVENRAVLQYHQGLLGDDPVGAFASRRTLGAPSTSSPIPSPSPSPPQGPSLRDAMIAGRRGSMY